MLEVPPCQCGWYRGTMRVRPGMRKHSGIFLCDRLGGRPHGWAGLPAQTCGHPTGNGQRAAMLRAARSSEQPCCELDNIAHRKAASLAAMQAWFAQSWTAYLRLERIFSRVSDGLWQFRRSIFLKGTLHISPRSRSLITSKPKETKNHAILNNPHQKRNP